MMRRLWVWIVVIGVALGGVLASAHDQFRFIGTVVRMEIGRNTLTIRTTENKKELTLKIAVTEKTPVTKDGKPVSRAELKPGTHIVVDALGDDYDDLDGVAVKIVPPPAK
jgi:hypothetical protein